MAYYTKRRTAGDFETVVARVQTALADEGFGVLCDIDLQAKLQEKLGIDEYRKYRVLGACNPALAREGLDAAVDLGVLLPCNVVVYEDDDGTPVVSAVDPAAMLSVVGNPALDSIAADVAERFGRVLDAAAPEPATA